MTAGGCSRQLRAQRPRSLRLLRPVPSVLSTRPDGSRPSGPTTPQLPGRSRFCPRLARRRPWTSVRRNRRPPDGGQWNRRPWTSVRIVRLLDEAAARLSRQTRLPPIVRLHDPRHRSLRRGLRRREPGPAGGRAVSLSPVIRPRRHFRIPIRRRGSVLTCRNQSRSSLHWRPRPRLCRLVLRLPLRRTPSFLRAISLCPPCRRAPFRHGPCSRGRHRTRPFLTLRRWWSVLLPSGATLRMSSRSGLS